MRHRRFRQVKIHPVQQPADNLAANRLGLRIFQFVFQIEAHARAELLQVFRAVFFRERVVHRRQNFFLHLDDFDFKNALLARKFLRHEIGGKIHVDRALVARLGADELLGKTGDEGVRPRRPPRNFSVPSDPSPSARCR